MVNLPKLNLVSLSGRDQGLASLVTDLPPDTAIDPTIEQLIEHKLGRLVEALTRRDDIPAVLR
jgi:hypothetical protein